MLKPVLVGLLACCVLFSIPGRSDASPSADSSEYLGGFNFYPAATRGYRFNCQAIDVNHSIGSIFDYYTTGQNGTTCPAALSVCFWSGASPA